ncbi:MAG: hypothetical protein IH605_00650 [Burkholderiales bacterium]|nr:hypothetical protein [Burkholderiales bacterium]
MKTRTVASVVALVACAALSAPAMAQWHGGHARIGVSIGVPLYAPYYYPPYPAPYYAPAIVVQQPPPTYIEQGAAQASPSTAQADWYYCVNEKAHYPYVQQCPSGWQRVPARPQG